MIAIVQRVCSASVYPKDNPAAKNSIGLGMCVLLGIADSDTQADLMKIYKKLTSLRIFADDQAKMNLSPQEAKAEILLVSQFTLISDTKKGNRPSFIKAAAPDKALKFFNQLSGLLSQSVPTKNGFFGEYMKLELFLDGPVTIVLDSTKL